MERGSELLQKARDWALGDPDPVTRAELEALIERQDVAELTERFAAPLSFGTAGLRGVVGAGPGRINRAVILRTTRAVALHLIAHDPDARTLPVVVGYDGRHTSRAFAEVVISVLAAAQIPVRFFDGPVPTPLVAYAVRALGATAGVVITASHNPAEYNGYKLYGKNGAQIAAPFDRDIEERLVNVGLAKDVPLADSAARAALVSPVAASLSERYLSDFFALPLGPPRERALRIVYTPLHGVGGALCLRALANAGFSNVVIVREQAEPDGAFPTVKSPNPEDSGTLDLATKLAGAERAELVLANDPDADRLAVCVPTASGRFVQLTGNQIGVLLADFVLERTAPSTKPLVVSSVVSTPMVARIAAAHGARSEVTGTGFKWIWAAGFTLEETEGYRFTFGFEEAIGFSIGRQVRDKDGISAALVFAEIAARCQERGASVLEELAGLYARYGLWVSAQRSVVSPGQAGLRELADAVNRAATTPPTSLGGYSVVKVVDYRQGGDERPFWLPTTPLVEFDLGNGCRALLRPSGTEPKLKIYVDLCEDPPTPAEMESAEAALRQKADTVALELTEYLGL
jgi:phosphomannomutase